MTRAVSCGWNVPTNHCLACPWSHARSARRARAAHRPDAQGASARGLGDDQRRAGRVARRAAHRVRAAGGPARRRAHRDRDALRRGGVRGSAARARRGTCSRVRALVGARHARRHHLPEGYFGRPKKAPLDRRRARRAAARLPPRRADLGPRLGLGARGRRPAARRRQSRRHVRALRAHGHRVHAAPAVLGGVGLHRRGVLPRRGAVDLLRARGRGAARVLRQSGPPRPGVHQHRRVRTGPHQRGLPGPRRRRRPRQGLRRRRHPATGRRVGRLGKAACCR
mmetsp:Transcript_11758/g.47461  ORF Transcript_11758/g.47461 Transcript_11758/m.47461 type:complete len:281 (-) Transcript_11758:1051-1893(-)